MSMVLYDEIAGVAAALPGRLGVAVRFVESGEEVLYHADDVFPAASVIKAAILVAVYEAAEEGGISLDGNLALPEARVKGSGVLRYLSRRLAPTVRDACWLMITVSDNVATNMLIELLGVERINSTIQRLGLERTTLYRSISFDAAGPFAETTPRDMLRLFAHLDAGTAASAASCAAMLDMLKECQSKDGIPRYLPIHDRDEAGPLPPSIEVAHKTGSLNGLRHDAGIVYLNTMAPPRRYIVSIFTADVADEALWTPENVAARAVAEVSRLVYFYAGSSAGRVG
jgi:beta-lactamase class A